VFKITICMSVLVSKKRCVRAPEDLECSAKSICHSVAAPRTTVVSDYRRHEGCPVRVECGSNGIIRR
jgi:hypothetical protein